MNFRPTLARRGMTTARGVYTPGSVFSISRMLPAAILAACQIIVWHAHKVGSQIDILRCDRGSKLIRIALCQSAKPWRRLVTTV
jgi:hypothetical protein